MKIDRKHHILRRVGKLLAQAGGTIYEAEAQTALAMAQRILLEEGLTLAEVDAMTEEEQKQLVANEPVDSMGATIIDWKWRLAYIVAKNFRNHVYVCSEEKWTRREPPFRGFIKKRQKTLRFVGLADDLAVARDVYICARDVAERLSRLYVQDQERLAQHLDDKYGSARLSDYTPGVKAAATREIRSAWIGGFLAGLGEKFKRQVVESESLALMLVVHPVVKSAVDDLNLQPLGYKSRVQYHENRDARVAGYETGKSFEHQPTKKLSEGMLQLPEAQ